MIFKKITAAVSAVAMMITIIPSVSFNNAKAEDNYDNIVVFGDGTAAGYAWDKSNEKLDYTYADLIGGYYNANVKNYGEKSQSVDDLIDKIENDNSVKQDLQKADLIIVSTGEDYVLDPAIETIKNHVDYTQGVDTLDDLLEKFSRSSTTKDGANLLDEILDDLKDKEVAILPLRNKYKKIADDLSGYDTKVIFTNLYDPFDVDTVGLGYDADQTRRINKLFEQKGKAYVENGVNKRMKEGIKRSDNKNCSVVDVQKAFAGHNELFTYIRDLDIHPSQAGAMLIASTILDSLGATARDTDEFTRAYQTFNSEQAEKIRNVTEQFASIDNYADTEATLEETTEPVTTVTTKITTDKTTTTITEKNITKKTTKSTKTTNLTTKTKSTDITQNKNISTGIQNTTAVPKKTDSSVYSLTTLTTTNTENTTNTTEKSKIGTEKTVTNTDSENKKIVVGDANRDNTVDSKDAAEILSSYADALLDGKKSAEIPNEIADINGDGIVDSKDAAEILLYYADKLLN